jgi:hypothetical protein
MKRSLLASLLVLAAIFLAACGVEPSSRVVAEPAAARDIIEPAVPPETTSLATATDEQGAVSVAVTPRNLSPAAQSLDFEVAMDTHSVDLSMDLATLATLAADNGRVVTASLWGAEPGGHHVTGILSFPAAVDGTAVLEGASQLVLTIRDVAVPERIFTWSLPHN